MALCVNTQSIEQMGDKLYINGRLVDTRRFGPVQSVEQINGAAYVNGKRIELD